MCVSVCVGGGDLGLVNKRMQSRSGAADLWHHQASGTFTLVHDFHPHGPKMAAILPAPYSCLKQEDEKGSNREERSSNPHLKK